MLAALAVPLVIFYFLKLRRTSCAVSSLALWRKVIEDKRVNSPFQRFRRHLLLLLQLLALAWLVLAAMQPFWGSHDPSRRLVPVMLDCSASMAATGEGGTTRLDEAKAEIQSLIDTLGRDQQMAILVFADYPRKLIDFSGDRRLLKQALDSVQPVHVSADITEAMRLASAMAQERPFDGIHLFSDGNIERRASMKLAFDVHYHPIEQGGPNLGISGLSARRSPSGAWDLLVQVDGSHAGNADIIVSNGVDEIARGRATVVDGKGDSLLFEVAPEERSVLSVSLRPDSDDSLRVDNEAFITLDVPRDVWVRLSSDGSDGAINERSFLRQALAVQRGIQIMAASDEASRADVLIGAPSDRGSPYVQVHTTGAIPADLADLLEHAQEPTEVVDWDRSDPLLRNVSLSEVVVSQAVRWKAPTDEHAFGGIAALEARGYTVLADGKEGPLLLRKEQEDQPTYDFLFRLETSDLPLRIGFPILIRNATGIGRDLAGLSTAGAPQTGVLEAITTAPDVAVTVKLPSGESEVIGADASGRASGVRAHTAGRYSWEDERGNAGIATASLLDPYESRLEVVEEIAFDEDLRITQSTAGWRTQRPLWTWLAALALVVLCYEWWVYQRGARGT